MDSPHLLVPIKVQALVIDDLVIKKSGVVEYEPGRFAANSGRWARQLHDYDLLLVGLKSPGPRPFYGATRTFGSHSADQLVLDDTSDALPEDKDRGVYLHWILPSGLRHAYTPGLLDFPALPDHWLIVRFARTGSNLKTNAWFVDGSSLAEDAGPTNLLFAETDKYEARSVGKVVPLERFASTNFGGEHTKITAIGNAQTGSPTFTAFTGENRNIFSWHDTLEDLRQSDAEQKVVPGTTLSYMLLGWYRDQAKEPLASPAAKLIEQRDLSNKLTGVLIDPPGFLIDTTTAIPDLKQRRAVFHGMVAHINYWSEGVYQGPMLGYPGSPRVEGSTGKATPAFQVGIGNNAEDALVSLVSSSYSGEQEAGMKKEAPNLWTAMEAVIYRQPETLVRSWNSAPRANLVHQNWFSTRDAGKIWLIRPRENKDGVFPSKPDETAAQTKVKPMPDQLAELKRLNEVQADADAVSHELAALQQELYGRWWKLCNKSRDRASLTAIAKDVSDVAARVEPLRTRRDQLLGQLSTLPDQLSKKLPPELELKYDAAQRFWSPADPVLVVKNCGCVTKHQFPRQLPCRLPEQIITTAEVQPDQNTKEDTRTFNQPAGVAEIAAAAKQHLPACPTIAGALLDEGSIVEQAVNDLAARSLPERKEFDSADDWQHWVDRLINDLTWNGSRETFPTDRVSFGKPGALDIKPQRVVELWGRQPWAPLFLDWQITWFPTPELPATVDGFGPNWPLRGFDYVPPDRSSIPSTGYTIRGRSLLTPIDGRVFDEPMQTLHDLLQAKRTGAKSPFPEAVVDVLSRFEIVWDKTLGELQRAGLMGQELTGFHQALLRRDVRLPRVTPDPTRPWIANKDQKKLEADVIKNLEPPDKEGLGGERLSPPTPTPPVTAPPTFPFSLIRAGALRIDELWLIDDFGQSADLLGLTPARGTSAGQLFHPRMRWHDDRDFIAMPPRILQPARLNFRFTNADDTTNATDPALSAICGWLFYNRLDQALVLCDRTGDLVGQLLVTKAEQNKFRITWDTDAGGIALDQIANEALKTFAKSFIETSITPKLLDLLNLIDRSLERIRPAAARNSALAGRPLALVNAAIGLELFGKAWTDPHKTGTSALPGTGDAALDALRVRINLGCRQNVEDGLVGYFSGNDYNHIVPGELPDKVTPTAYISDPNKNLLRVGFNAPEKLTLLMDPWGSVQAACGLVPAKTIALAHPELDKTVTQMETSFRVGPVLVQAGKIAMPTPTGEKGKWNFYGPFTDQHATVVAPFDPKSLSDQTVVATEGRLLLVNEE